MLRITPNVNLSRALLQSQQHTRALADLQMQASTGLRLLEPSDDPAAMRAVLREKGRQARWETELANIQDATSRLNGSVAQLLDAKDIISRAREIALEANNRPADDSALETLAKEVDGLLQRLLSIANSQEDGRYLFAGADGTTAPFSVAGGNASGSSAAVRYTGSDERTSLMVAPDMLVPTLYSGAEVFLPRSRGETIVVGQTGIRPGAGTDSAIGRGQLLVRHVATAYAPGSGVQAGTGSPAGDTILGPAGTHTLRITDTSGTGAGGTVSLNGGTAIAFTSADANLRVEGPAGEIVYVDLTAVTAGFAGDVAVAASGEMSIDGGRTFAAIDFSANQQLVNRETGEVTHLDTSGARRVGTDRLEYTGTAGVFAALGGLQEDLRNTRQFEPAELHEALARDLDDLQRLQDHILRIVGEQSADLENLQALELRIQDLQVASEQIQSDKESADMTEVVLRLQNEKTLLQFTYTAMATVLDTSLLDVLR